MDRQISIYHSEVDVHEVSPILEGQLNDLPPISSRIVRVFISSTFSASVTKWRLRGHPTPEAPPTPDTLEERNALMENVYPKLKDFCRDQHGLEFQKPPALQAANGFSNTANPGLRS
ncbi:hypothetical protein LSAT2_001634 [Lamellibrachia satsuma]|nr:hypothetical protein LSAT2_001634 [Lamellibrachia satsuma]